MADASSTAKKTKKPKAAPPAPAPPVEEGPLTAWRTWGILGVVLVGGVIAWKLLGSTYHSDVETICSAEKGSGYTMEKDMSKVSNWVRAHLATPEGNELYSSIQEAKMAERAKKLQAEATAQKIDGCPLVASFEQLAAEADYRSDLQHLCSGVSFAKLAEDDDARRLARLEEWIDKLAKSPRTKDLADPLRNATPPERAKLLRDAAGKMDVFTCEVAKTLESPQQAPKPKGPPMVRPYSAPQIIGNLSEEDLAKGIAAVTPAMNDCYRKGLEKNDALAGKLALKLHIDPDGNVTSDAPAESTLTDKDTVQCILAAVRKMKLPKNPGPLVTALVPLEATSESAAALPDGAPAPAPPASAGKPAPSTSSSGPAAAPSPPPKK